MYFFLKNTCFSRGLDDDTHMKSKRHRKTTKVNQMLRPPLKQLCLLAAAILCAFGHCDSSQENVKGIYLPAAHPACSAALNADGFNGGDGSEADPYRVCTYAQLDMIRMALGRSYVLGDHINASSTCGGDCENPTGSGWVPTGSI